MRVIGLLLVLCLAAPGAGAGEMTLTSKVFFHQKDIPQKYTCQGANVSPPLTWADLPKGTKSLVLIVDDPDAPDPKKPKMVWDHWLLYNLPATAKGLPEGVKVKDLPKGTLQGKNSWKKTGYGGPCPPIGRHRYFHKLFALDTVLKDLGTPNKKKLLEAMQGHILKKTELIGTYQKKK
jgi:Raf kinase inhibitor-like YbhB/YbcL family protein